MIAKILKIKSRKENNILKSTSHSLWMLLASFADFPMKIGKYVYKNGHSLLSKIARKENNVLRNFQSLDTLSVTTL